jgi:hypothetical protein
MKSKLRYLLFMLGGAYTVGQLNARTVMYLSTQPNAVSIFHDSPISKLSTLKNSTLEPTKGKVLTEDGEGISGVIILLKVTSRGTFTYQDAAPYG